MANISIRAGPNLYRCTTKLLLCQKAISCFNKAILQLLALQKLKQLVFQAQPTTLSTGNEHEQDRSN